MKDEERMEISVPNFTGANVLVVGDVMLDRYWHGPTRRISPEAPVPVVQVNSIEERPGGAANVAMNIASLGVGTKLIGLTGADEASEVLTAKLKEVNVACNFTQVPTHPTVIKLRVLSRHQQLLRLDFEQSFASVDSQRMLQPIEDALSAKTDVVVLSDYAKGALSGVQQMIQFARKAKVPVLVDPKGSNFTCYRGATLLTPNLSEFETVVGYCKNEDELVTRGRKLMAELEISALLITRSEQGMTLLQAKNQLPLHLPTHAQAVFDVTGAGDTVIGVLAAALAAGDTLEESCILANIAAGIVVGKLGASTVAPIELENVIRGRTETSLGVVTEEQLKKEVAQAHKRGEKIVMTNGCFDILHVGHVSYLAHARKLGDRLIVAVNSDTSTKRLKGKTRPVNPLAQRMTTLSALGAVDWVVPFEEDTPQRLITEILPDILVKGGDYQSCDIAGSQAVLAAGGEVKTLNFETGVSTSKIIQVIKNEGS